MPLLRKILGLSQWPEQPRKGSLGFGKSRLSSGKFFLFHPDTWIMKGSFIENEPK